MIGTTEYVDFLLTLGVQEFIGRTSVDEANRLRIWWESEYQNKVSKRKPIESSNIEQLRPTRVDLEIQNASESLSIRTAAGVYFLPGHPNYWKGNPEGVQLVDPEKDNDPALAEVERDYGPTLRSRIGTALSREMTHARALLRAAGVKVPPEPELRTAWRAEESQKDGTIGQEHTCHVPRCYKIIPPRLLMCRAHWIRVPRLIQGFVWAAYVEGQEIRKDPSKMYLEIAYDAIRAVQESTTAKDGCPKCGGDLVSCRGESWCIKPKKENGCRGTWATKDVLDFAQNAEPGENVPLPSPASASDIGIGERAKPNQVQGSTGKDSVKIASQEKHAKKTRHVSRSKLAEENTLTFEGVK